MMLPSAHLLAISIYLFVTLVFLLIMIAAILSNMPTRNGPKTELGILGLFIILVISALIWPVWIVAYTISSSRRN